ncbi:MAG: sigma 54-interacting transcriptional regulator, partial [Thermicanus sp.]|nr:sigma 54-interacting transcriptional regulator [Thermicanus sp.]
TMREVKELAEKAAMSKSTVLLQGESGTGKELFAHAIHAASPRHHGPFIRVNCGAIPTELLESELFGYEEGAFTGAKKGGKPGKFELANGGTLFLDEVGDLPLSMQAKILRVLQEKEIEPLGSIRLKKVDVRVIAATHKDLKKMVDLGEFRHDLYYRLNVFTLTIPPLRERKEDIPPLVSAILQKLSQELGIMGKGLSDEVLHLFQTYHWPGNIRELYNALERSVAVSEKGEIEVKDLPLYLRDMSGSIPHPSLQPLDVAIRETEKQLIQQALKETGGNKVRAAEILGIHRANLYRKLDRYGL